MSLIVQKFGGSSVANAQRVMNVARIVTDTYKAGNDVVVVVSAQGDTTDDLIAKAMEINPKAAKREMDQLLAAGEPISISLLALAIESLGFPVISLLGWQAGFETNSNHSAARIKRVVYGAPDRKAGCCGSVTDLFRERFNHHPEVCGGVLAEESAALLTSFFKRLRNV